MKIKYIADDGEEFNTKEECEAYEKSRADTYREVNDGCIFYDANGNRVLIDEDNSFDKVFFVECLTDEAAIALEEYLDENECLSLFEVSKLPLEKGCYYYTEGDLWHDINEVRALLAKLETVFDGDPEQDW